MYEYFIHRMYTQIFCGSYYHVLIYFLTYIISFSKHSKQYCITHITNILYNVLNIV